MAQLARIVTALDGMMHQRFAREEGCGGFHAFVSTAAPRYVTMMNPLRAEHATIGDRLDALQRAIAEAGDAAWPELLAELKAIVVAIDNHEALDDAILVDVLQS